jgi:hypothetical protein
VRGSAFDPLEMLDMINGRKILPPFIVKGLARELDLDQRYLEKLAGELRK